SSLPTWRGAPRTSSSSTTSAARASSGSRRARGRSNGPGCHAIPSPPTWLAFSFTRSPTISATSCARWRRRSDQGLVDDDAAQKADQDRREGRRSRALRLVPDGRGCYTAHCLCRHLAHYRGTSAASNHVSGVVSSVVTRLNETTGKVCLYDGKFRIS